MPLSSVSVFLFLSFSILRYIYASFPNIWLAERNSPAHFKNSTFVVSFPSIFYISYSINFFIFRLVQLHVSLSIGIFKFIRSVLLQISLHTYCTKTCIYFFIILRLNPWQLPVQYYRTRYIFGTDYLKLFKYQRRFLAGIWKHGISLHFWTKSLLVFFRLLPFHPSFACSKIVPTDCYFYEVAWTWILKYCSGTVIIWTIVFTLHCL